MEKQMPESETKTLLNRCRETFFVGQVVAEFKAEWQALTPKDREELTAAFNAEGMPTT